MFVAYPLGIAAVCAFLGFCWLARAGVGWAKSAAGIEVQVLMFVALMAFLLALVLMLVGCPENCSSAGESWWVQGRGQQFLAACVGLLVLTGAVVGVWQRRYLLAAVLVVGALGCFGLWGLLVYAGWSNKGPLALDPAASRTILPVAIEATLVAEGGL